MVRINFRDYTYKKSKQREEENLVSMTALALLMVVVYYIVCMHHLHTIQTIHHKHHKLYIIGIMCGWIYLDFSLCHTDLWNIRFSLSMFKLIARNHLIFTIKNAILSLEVTRVCPLKCHVYIWLNVYLVIILQSIIWACRLWWH